MARYKSEGRRVSATANTAVQRMLTPTQSSQKPDMNCNAHALIGSRSIRSPGDSSESPNLQPRKRQSVSYRSTDENLQPNPNVILPGDCSDNPLFAPSKLEFIVENLEQGRTDTEKGALSQVESSQLCHHASDEGNENEAEAAVSTGRSHTDLQLSAVHSSPSFCSPSLPKGKRVTPHTSTSMQYATNEQVDDDVEREQTSFSSSNGSPPMPLRNDQSGHGSEESPPPVFSQYRLEQFLDPLSPLVTTPNKDIGTSTPRSAQQFRITIPLRESTSVANFAWTDTDGIFVSQDSAGDQFRRDGTEKQDIARDSDCEMKDVVEDSMDGEYSKLDGSLISNDERADVGKGKEPTAQGLPGDGSDWKSDAGGAVMVDSGDDILPAPCLARSLPVAIPVNCANVDERSSEPKVEEREHVAAAHGHGSADERESSEQSRHVQTDFGVTAMKEARQNSSAVGNTENVARLEEGSVRATENAEDLRGGEAGSSLASRRMSCGRKMDHTTHSQQHAVEDAARRLPEEGARERELEPENVDSGGGTALASQSEDELDASKWLSSWQIPATVCSAYAQAGVVELYPWQVDCIESTRVLEERANLVYCAPTSAGKTLVAEVVSIRTLLEDRKRVFFVVPFVSIVMEKVEYFRKLLEEEPVQVQGYCSGCLGSSNQFSSSNPELSVCTIEKANGIVNRLLQEHRGNEIGAIVVDEVHMISDSSRGPLLEILLSKLLFKARDSIQMVFLSATVPNIEDLARWINAQLFVTDFRPVPLTEHLVVNREVLNPHGTRTRTLLPADPPHSDPDGIVCLCTEALQLDSSVLVFCSTKRACEHCATLLSSDIKPDTLPDSLERRQLRSHLLHKLAQTPTGLDPTLAKTVPRGVAFHHAGLTVEERQCLETAFDEGVIGVLAATSTLAAGVNLPAHRVIFRSPYVGPTLLDVARYRQMSGRAGRAGKDLSGESFVICGAKDKEGVVRLMHDSMRPIASCLTTQDSQHAPHAAPAVGIRRAVLEAVDNEIAGSKEQVRSFLACTFDSAMRGEARIVAEATEATAWLVQKQMVSESEGEGGILATTHLGKAVVASSLAPHEALMVYEDLKEARVRMALDDDLHLIYLNTPVMSFEVPWLRFFDLYQQLGPQCRRIAEMLGVQESFLLRSRTRKPGADVVGGWMHATDGKGREIGLHARFFSAMMVRELVQESGLQHVSNKFHVPRGVVQQLQTQSISFAGMVSTFCGKLQWWQLESLCAHFQERLSHGVSGELLPLMKVPSMRSVWARAFYSAGKTTPGCLARSTPAALADIMTAAMPFVSDFKKGQGWEQIQAQKILKGAKKLAVEQELYVGGPGAAGLAGGEAWYKTARNAAAIVAMEKEWEDALVFGAACHTEGGDGSRARVVGIAVSVGPGRTWYLPVDPEKQGAWFKSLHAVFRDDSKTKVIGDIKRQIQTFRKLGLDPLGPLDDPLLAAWLLQVKGQGAAAVEALARGFGMQVPGTEGGSGVEEKCCVEAACAVLVLSRTHQQLVDFGMNEYYRSIEMPTALALAGMEDAGVGVCESTLRQVEAQIRGAQAAIGAAVEKLAGKTVDLGSSAAVVGLLYDTLQIPLPVSVATSGWKARNLPRLCASNVLKELAKQHAGPALILQHKKMNFLLTHTVRPLSAACRKGGVGQTGRVHPKQLLRACDTGRIAVKGPNIQCLPKPIKLPDNCHVEAAKSARGVQSGGLDELETRRDRDGGDASILAVRRCIVAKHGRVLLCGDYKQLELRLIAHLSRDQGLIHNLLSGGDVFRAMAAGWGKISEAEVSEKARDQAKRVCYGLMYGMGAATLAGELGVDQEEAAKLMTAFRGAYPAVDALIKTTIESARSEGFVKTLMGRKRWFPDLISPNANKRAAAERQAFNTLVQGSAADILRMALVATTSGITPAQGAVVMQVHDELMLEVDEASLPEVAAVLKTCMESAAGELQVPLEVKLNCGVSWGNLVELRVEGTVTKND